MVKDKRIEVEENKIALQGNKNHMYFIREKILRYMNDKDMTQDEFSEYAGISLHTLHSILYKHADDIKLSTAIRIAKAIGIGVDELANTGALSDVAMEAITSTRSLPKHIMDLIFKYIKWQKNSYEKSKNYPGKIIDVMDLDYVDAHLRATNHFEKVDISEFDKDIKSIVFKGMRIPCEDYYQYYREDDILLLSTIRPPQARERCVVSYYNRLFIVQKAKQNGVAGYRGIRDEETFIPETDIDHYFGYVAGVKHP